MPYDEDVSFHEPLTFFAYAADVTPQLGLVLAASRSDRWCQG